MTPAYASEPTGQELDQGQTKEFFELLADLAADADRAKRECDHEGDEGD
jgi:hypothetical protein